MNLLIQADGGPNMGWGHVMRCYAIAQAWRRANGRCKVFWLSSCLSKEIKAKLKPIKAKYVGMDHGLTDPIGWVINDSPWSRILGPPLEAKTLHIDDVGANVPVADLVVNYALPATLFRYTKPALLGPRYTPIRDEIRQAKALCKAKTPTMFVAKGCSKVAWSAKHYTRVTAEDAEADGRLEHAMAEASIAFTTGGLTSQELLYLGVPAAIAVNANDQVLQATGMAAAGVAVLGTTVPREEELSKMVGRLPEYIDGRGADRIVQAMVAQ